MPAVTKALNDDDIPYVVSSVEDTKVNFELLFDRIGRDQCRNQILKSELSNIKSGSYLQSLFTLSH